MIELPVFSPAAMGDPWEMMVVTITACRKMHLCHSSFIIGSKL